MEDLDGNIIVLELDFDGKKLAAGSVYGPNQNDNTFFVNLNDFLYRIKGKGVVLGGDWNLTYDNRNLNENQDVHSMVNVPSIFRSNKLREICDTYNLVDPFRFLHPNKCDYTFIPTAVNNLNRSCIDFFLTNVELAHRVTCCNISTSLLSAHFDHKCITLNFARKKMFKTYPIKNSILKEDEVNWQVRASVIETYIQHAVINEQFTVDQKNAFLLVIGEILILTQESIQIKMEIAVGEVDILHNLRIAAIKPLVEEAFSSLPPLDFFENLVRPDYCNYVHSLTLWSTVSGMALSCNKKRFSISVTKGKTT
jgi:hypothetical protein